MPGSPCCLDSLHVARSALTAPPGGLQEALALFSIGLREARQHQHQQLQAGRQVLVSGQGVCSSALTCNVQSGTAAAHHSRHTVAFESGWYRSPPLGPRPSHLPHLRTSSCPFSVQQHLPNTELL
jgi:hypothetical protein